MSGPLSARIARLEDWIGNRTCTSCYGAAYATVFIPEGEDEDDPEYNPTECPECGRSLQVVTHIVGVSEAEFLGDQPEMAR
jgi:hypothetical protein